MILPVSVLGDTTALANKGLIAVTFIGAALANDAPASHLSEWLEVSPALVKGALVGAILFAINEPGSLRRRLGYFITCFGVAYLGGEWANTIATSFASWLDSLRGWSFILALLGVYIVRIVTRVGATADRRADTAADAVLDRVIGRRNAPPGS